MKYVSALALLLLATTAARAQVRAVYDARGHFAGSSIQHGNSTSFYNGRGQFSGSAIRQRDGTTSLYDRGGHFSGSISRSR
jgi:hypothetical protein